MKQPSLSFIFINGRGPSGKDTQADLLVAENPYAIRISTGDIYRGARTPDGAFGKFYEQIKPYIESVDKGGYIPDEVILPIVDRVIEGHIQDGKDAFIFTGFPRTVEQLQAVDKYTKSLEERYKEVNVNYVCYAVLPEHSKRRAEQRRENAQSTGTAVRKDDEPEIVLTRLKTYQDKTEPMLKLLTKEGRLIIVKSNGTIREVQERTKLALEKANKNMLEGSKSNREVHGNPHKER